MAMRNNIKGGNLLLLFLQFFRGGIWMLSKVFSSWQWNPTLFKPWLKWWPLHPTKQTPSLWTCWHAWGRWSMHLNTYLIPFWSTWSEQRFPWFMLSVLLKMNVVSILFLSWRTKCAITWTFTCKWLLQCMHINYSHLIPFHMRLFMICG